MRHVPAGPGDFRRVGAAAGLGKFRGAGVDGVRPRWSSDYNFIDSYTHDDLKL